MKKTSDKIVTFDELEPLISKEKRQGKKIVLCHGVFDLLHAGHLLHFRSAKQHGDVLVVSVTPDRFVNKGPHRPQFNENVRLQNIAEVESVNYVVLNEWATAIETIFKIKPDIYAKGFDYANPKEDVTGNIKKEEAAIKEINGKVIFTNEPSLSSSNLLNEFFPSYSEEARKFLKEFKQRYTLSDIFKALDQLSSLKVLIIGESILDRYTYCAPLAKSTKETILATKYQGEENFLGGALAVANHMANFCSSVTLITQLGSEEAIHHFVSKNLHGNIHLKNVLIPGRQTIVKQRFVEPDFLTKIFEIQDLNDDPIPLESELKTISLLQEELSHHDLIVVADYGHGFIRQAIIQELMKAEAYLCVNAQTNSANLGYNLITKYPRADYICIDAAELRLAANGKYFSMEEMIHTLKQKINFSSLLVSLGAKGTVMCTEDSYPYYTPVFSNKIVDRTGAGDSLFSITSPLVFLKCPLPILGLIANCVGALKVKTVCNREPIHAIKLKKFITTLLA